MGAGGRDEPVSGRRARIAVIREARAAAPVLVALSILCLACLGGLRVVATPLSGPEFASAFWVTLFALASPVLFLAGVWLLCSGHALSWIEKAVGIGTALIVPVSFAFIRPYLPGWYESCASGSESAADGKIISSYSHCVGGPTGITHAVEWVWTLVPLAITFGLGVLAVRRAPAGTEPTMGARS